jgi:hypothetical protein
MLAMTVNAESHVRKIDSQPDFRHGLNLAVAFLAWDPFGHVGVVIKVDEIADHVHPHPWDRLVLLEGITKPDDLGPIRCNKLVASHAKAFRGNTGRSSPPDAAVAILALDLIVTGVDLVAECNRLPRPGVGTVAAIHHQGDGESEERGKSEANNRMEPRGHHGGFFLSASNSAALHGARTACSFRTESTWAAVTAPPLFPHAERTWVRTAAISSLDNLSWNWGILLSNVFPFTPISPCNP